MIEEVALPESVPSAEDRGYRLGVLAVQRNLRRLWSAVQAAGTTGLEPGVGEIRLFAGPTAPTGWLQCHGQLLLRADYPELFDVVGTTYGSTLLTNFRLPDLRGRVPLGAGSGGGLSPRALADTGGSEQHILTIAEMPAHTHTISDTGGFSVQVSDESVVAGGTGHYVRGAPGTSIIQADSKGAGDDHENMQPWLALCYIIRV